MIFTILGTRPEIIKLSILIKLLNKKYGNQHKIVYTGQHYSNNMSDIFFEEFGLKPDFNINSRTSNSDDIEKELIKIFEETNPEFVIVYGDTNSTLSGARAAKKINAKIIHIEAGLRSFDNEMPEEKNRVEVDKISSILFTPTELTKSFLQKENITKNVHVVGNVVVDTCLEYSKKYSKIMTDLDLPEKYALLTIHRQEIVDNFERLSSVFEGISEIPLPVIFPIHPRTKKRIKEHNIQLPNNIKLIEPIGYVDFLHLMKTSQFILTDSGGLQEEAITLNIPCLTLRKSTERWETVIEGANFIVGWDGGLIKYYSKMIMEGNLGKKMRSVRNPYGEGNTSSKIIEILNNFIQ